MKGASSILTVALLLVTAAGGGAADFASPGVFYVAGMAVDLLGAEADEAARIQSPGLSIRSEAKSGRLHVRTLDDVPRSRLELELAQRHLQQAEVHIRTSDFGKAMFELRDGLSLNPSDPRLLSRAAVLMAERRDYENAASYFRRYLEINPTDLSHAAAYAAVLLRMARFEEADTVLKTAELRSPDFMPLRFTRTCLELIRENRVVSADFWRRRQVDETEAIAQWLQADRGELLRIMGPEDLGRLCDLTLGPDTLRSLGDIVILMKDAREARARGEFKAAIEAWSRLGALGVQSFGVGAAVAEAAETGGDVDRALLLWGDLAKRFSDWPQAWLSYGHVLLRTGNFAQALPAARRAKELAPEAFVIDFLLASGHALQGDTAEAQKIFNQLVTRHPVEFRKWLDSDAVFEAALRKMPNRVAILRQLEIPPESE